LRFTFSWRTFFLTRLPLDPVDHIPYLYIPDDVLLDDDNPSAPSRYMPYHRFVGDQVSPRMAFSFDHHLNPGPAEASVFEDEALDSCP
jgi:hypothetical protein